MRSALSESAGSVVRRPHPGQVAEHNLAELVHATNESLRIPVQQYKHGTKTMSTCAWADLLVSAMDSLIGSGRLREDSASGVGALAPDRSRHA